MGWPCSRGTGLGGGGRASWVTCASCLLVSLLLPGKLAFWFQGQHQMLGEQRSRCSREANLANGLTGVDGCKAEVCSVWILFSFFLSLQSQANITSSPSSAGAALELSPCAHLMWDFSLTTQFCPAFLIQGNGLWHDEECEDGGEALTIPLTTTLCAAIFLKAPGKAGGGRGRKETIAVALLNPSPGLGSLCSPFRSHQVTQLLQTLHPLLRALATPRKDMLVMHHSRSWS